MNNVLFLMYMIHIISSYNRFKYSVLFILFYMQYRIFKTRR